MELSGLHHVTAVTGHAGGNVRFYRDVLGMRLVKKTVNQDDVSAYHLFYADGMGSPGTDMTFFDWPNAGENIPGAGSIISTAFRVPDRAALDYWQARFDELGVERGEIAERLGHVTLPFADPEGQQLALVAGDGAGMEPGVPWADSPVPAEHQIRGLHSVTLAVAQLDGTAWALTEVLGFRPAREYASTDEPQVRVVVFETGSGGAGTEVYVIEQPGLGRGRLGIGGVHHVAFRVPTDEEHRAWRDRVRDAGLGITDVIDRFYFKSLYFREPGHVLYELATDEPGFAVDEDPAHLGEQLALPPFLEPRRAEIEAGLAPIEV